jgi:homoserine dehydrogenase
VRLPLPLRAEAKPGRRNYARRDDLRPRQVADPSWAVVPPGVKRVRLWVVGFGTVGQWLVRALDEHRARLREQFRLSFEVIGLANQRDGFVYSQRGVDVQSALRLAAAGQALPALADVSHWPTALEGIRATDADVLVEVSASPASGGEPGVSHLQEALARGIPAVTSNKWPVALHGLRLNQLARRTSAPLRAESTVMSGTPVLSTLTKGLAGASPTALRGVLNATANFVLSEMARGRSYAKALDGARRRGVAERDPSADVDGHDTVAKLMILAALVFGHQLRVSDVSRRGISSLTEEEISEGRSEGLRIRELATLAPSTPAAGSLAARVEPVRLGPDDLLAGVDGTNNAVTCEAEPLGEVTVIGPGAGVQLAGQGVLSDLINIARR